MRMPTIAFMSPQFAVLSESQMQDLHLAALETLRRTGIRFYPPGSHRDAAQGRRVRLRRQPGEDHRGHGRRRHRHRPRPHHHVRPRRRADRVPRRDQGQLRHRVGLPEPARPRDRRTPPVHPAGPHQRLSPVRCAAEHRLRDVDRHPGGRAAARHLRRADGADAGAHQQAAGLRHQRQGKLPAGDRHGRGRGGRLRRSLRSKPTSCSTPSPARRSSNRRPPSTSCC